MSIGLDGYSGRYRVDLYWPDSDGWVGKLIDGQIVWEPIMNVTMDKKNSALDRTGKAPNPKEAFGNKKPALTLCPLSASIAQQEAHLDGLLKYGWFNWRENAVEAQTYIDAAMRHLRLFEVGEELARDTKVKNLGAVMACCAILIDAELHGMMIDNRKHSPQSADMLEDAYKMVQALKDRQKERDNAK